MKILLKRLTLLNFEKPPIDVLEDEDKYIVIVDVPDVDKDDIEIIGDEKSITIKGVRHNKFAGKYLIMERFSGLLKRTIRFPSFIDLSQSKAYYQNGTLTIYISKAKNRFIIDNICKIIIF